MTTLRTTLSPSTRTTDAPWGEGAPRPGAGRGLGLVAATLVAPAALLASRALGPASREADARLLGGVLLVGVVAEALLLAGARHAVLCRAWGWLAEGPRRWFRPAPELAAVLALAALGLTAFLGQLYLASGVVVAGFHVGVLMALAITLAAAVALAVVVSVVVLLAPLAVWAATAAGRAASPGVVLVALAAASLAAVVRVAPTLAGWLAPDACDAAGLALAATEVAVLVALGVWRRRAGCALPDAWGLAAGGVALLLALETLAR